MKEIARRFALPCVESLGAFSLVKEQKQLLPYLFAKEKIVLPLEISEQGVKLAVSNPLNLEVIKELRLFLGMRISPVYCCREEILKAIEHCYQQKEGETTKLFAEHSSKEKTVLSEDIEGYDLLAQDHENTTIRMVDAVFLEAIQQGASDIHFEPGETELVIRYRIDGVLQKKDAPSIALHNAIATRIKVMAKMDIAEQRLPQDGRIKLRQGGRTIDFRVSTLPTVYGERISLRILDRQNVLLGLDQLGMDDPLLESFYATIRSPEGILLVTGPTGSGKTTTLYSALSEINRGFLNILTIEDPVEYKIPNISQMNVNTKIDLDFARGLRHILRQDPDVIMIGEIRDQETAEIAIQASLTGHLVLSTLHTNDAPSALTRLADMGIEPYLLASSIIGVLAQRLVRAICPLCKTGYRPSEKELLSLAIEPKPHEEVLLYRGKGCNSCFGSGYRGRRAIYEWMPVKRAIKEQIMQSVDAEQLRQTALKEGMVSLFMLGKEFVRRGETTVSELLRVVNQS